MNHLSEFITYNLEWYLTAVLAWMKKHAKLPFLVDDMQMTNQVLLLFNSYLLPYKEEENDKNDKETEAYLNKINPAVENTFIIYKNAEIVDKFINLAPTETNFLLLKDVLDKTKGSFFN